jgi:hypothetical protein
MDTAEDNLDASMDQPMLQAFGDQFSNPFLPEPVFPTQFYISTDSAFTSSSKQNHIMIIVLELFG